MKIYKGYKWMALGLFLFIPLFIHETFLTIQGNQIHAMINTLIAAFSVNLFVGGTFYSIAEMFLKPEETTE